VDNQSDSDNISRQAAYQTLFLLMDDAVIVFNHLRKIIQLNPASEILLQMPQDKAIGQTLNDVMESQHNMALSLESLPHDPIRLHVDDDTRYYMLNLKPIPEQLGYVLVFDDVTNEQQAITEVDQLRAAFGDYAHVVGHDVKSPLNVVIGYSNMLQNDLEQGTESHFFADEIFDMSMRIMYICNELLVLSQLMNHEEVDIAPVNLSSVFDSVLRHFTKDIATQNIAVRISDTIPNVQGNLPWVEEILVSYLRYAIKDSASTTVVEVGGETLDDDMIRIWVQHDGYALSHTEQAALFDLNINIESVRAEGQGLPFGVIKMLVEQLQGTVDVHGGQVIYFTLPADIQDK
jgi:two-component system, OmpR family, phosphate regulon sensor histidine kinase PhoR